MIFYVSVESCIFVYETRDMVMESGIASVTSTIDMCVRISCDKFMSS